jgi:serine phosphatase RsbU (regulator of sigma subunit)/tetratricopeptide (TPR) repeat protein
MYIYRYMVKIKLYILFQFLYCCIISQNSDSIYKSINTIKSDSLKINLIITHLVTPNLNNGNYNRAHIEILKANQFVNGNKNLDFKLKSQIINLLINQELFKQANDSTENLLQASIKSKNIYYQGTAYRLKAMIEMYIGNLDKSSDYYFKALEKFKDTKYNPAIARAYSDVAAINYYSEKYDKAIEYWRKSLSMSSEDKDYQFIANSLSNLGIAFLEHNDFDSSEVTLKRAIIIANIIHDESIKASIYTNLTKLEYNRKNYKKAIEYSNQAALYYEATKNYSKLSNIYSNGAELARTGKDYQTALIYINKAFEAMKLTENKTNLNTLYLNKAAIQYDLKDYKPAYENLLNYIYQKDSLVNIENQKNINELEKKYQLTEQKKENALLNEQLKTQEIYSSRMQITIGLISLIVVILAVTAFLVIKQNRAKNLINAQLFEKNNIINLQKSIVEDQHRDITDSIKYAKRIQEAILPPLNLWNKILPSSFILHLPKDVLSGDFYWIEETENYTYVAAADCTGHGVPGALISIVNFNLLNKAVLEKNLVTPNEILDAVNLWLTESLHQTYGESTVRDGMDITLIALHKHSNEVLFAGANNSIYTVSNGELNQIKGDKFPVGAFIEDKIQKFSMQRFTVEKGDSIFLFSDGFADQFGGPKGKKYKYLPFQQKLTSITNLNISQQQASMKQEFLDWKGSHEQVDDVLVIGIKIS